MDLFDKKAFDSLIDRDKELFVELLHLYAIDYPQILIDLKQAVGGSDFQQVEILAHRLRGMVRNFFAPELASQAEEIENGGREGRLEDVDTKLEVLAKGLKRLEDELAQHLRSFA